MRQEKHELLMKFEEHNLDKQTGGIISNSIEICET